MFSFTLNWLTISKNTLFSNFVIDIAKNYGKAILWNAYSTFHLNMFNQLKLILFSSNFWSQMKPTSRPYLLLTEMFWVKTDIILTWKLYLTQSDIKKADLERRIKIQAIPRILSGNRVTTVSYQQIAELLRI